MSYFIYDPWETKPELFESEEAFIEAVNNYDFYGRYCEDGWSEEVLNVVAGFIPEGVKRNDDEESESWEDESDFYDRYATHHVVETGKEEKPADLDEDGYSVSYGGEWPHPKEYDYICDYKFEAIQAMQQAEGSADAS